MGTVHVLDFIRIMCTLPSNYIARNSTVCKKVITFLAGDTIILRETIIVHKKVVPSLLIKKQTLLQESSNENNYYHEQEGEYAA